MQASVFIVQRGDGLVRAMARLLESEGYEVRTAESVDLVREQLASAGRPAVLLVDEDDAGPDWRERLAAVPADVPRVVLTWHPGAEFPSGVTPLGKPFSATALLAALANAAAPGGVGPPGLEPGRRSPGEGF